MEILWDVVTLILLTLALVFLDNNEIIGVVTIYIIVISVAL
jgi:hypothetical protein